MEPPRSYYTLPELAEKWNRPENDLLHMAAAGELVISIKYRGYVLDQSTGHILLIKDHIQLSAKSAEAFQDGCAKIDIARYNGKSVMVPTDDPSLKRFMAWASEFDECYPIVSVCPLEIKSTKDLRIFPREVARVEAKFPQLAGEKTGSGKDHEPNGLGITYDIPQGELAKVCNVTSRTVSNWAKGGLLCEKRGREKLYSRTLTAEWLEKNDRHKELESFNNLK